MTDVEDRVERAMHVLAELPSNRTSRPHDRGSASRAGSAVRGHVAAGCARRSG